jgi:hypothetical protein
LGKCFEANKTNIRINQSKKRMNGKIKYEFCTKVWQYTSPSGWHFASLPTEIVKEIRTNLKWQEEG